MWNRRNGHQEAVAQRLQAEREFWEQAGDRQVLVIARGPGTSEYEEAARVMGMREPYVSAHAIAHAISRGLLTYAPGPRAGGS